MNEQCYPENIEEIKKFAGEIDIDVKYLLGEKWEGDLDLPFVESLPENIVFNVGGHLDLSYLKSLPDNVIFNVGGQLWFHVLKTIPANAVFNVGGEFFLSTAHKVKVDWS